MSQFSIDCDTEVLKNGETFGAFSIGCFCEEAVAAYFEKSGIDLVSTVNNLEPGEAEKIARDLAFYDNYIYNVIGDSRDYEFDVFVKEQKYYVEDIEFAEQFETVFVEYRVILGHHKFKFDERRELVSYTCLSVAES
jgi:hypothetical protein